MGLPVVAIVGRPNVGKSSLFNVITGRRTSIVDPTAGVTRDRVSAVCDIDDVFFELVDTGGFGIQDVDDLTEHVERQIGYAIEQAALILFVVDVQDGVVPLDQTVAELLRKHHRRVVLLANKTDSPVQEPQASEFGRLGYGAPLCVSAVHAVGKRELLERVAVRLRDAGGTEPTEPEMCVALIGRRNTGKSTFINALAGAERVITSEVPGTTRDAIDVRFEFDGRSFIAIDTAGVRKKRKMDDAIEFYAFTRMQQSIDRADVVLFLIDAAEPTSRVDKTLATYLVDQHKPVVLVVNKWDLAKGQAGTDEYGQYLARTLGGLGFAPMVFTTAITGKNVTAAVDTASSLFKQARVRVGTGVLNRAFDEIKELRGPSAKRGTRRPKLFYATQVAVAPPTIVLFVNDDRSVDERFVRFLASQFRERLPYPEVPIRLILRPRHEESRTPDRPRPAIRTDRRRVHDVRGRSTRRTQ
ncbi:MAG: ribosome biogenesis GTPase Der [Phycisphaerales bacterium]|nr:ribosome biogenesis GTPase Der [Phycisphaerales bacterium]